MVSVIGLSRAMLLAEHVKYARWFSLSGTNEYRKEISELFPNKMISLSMFLTISTPSRVNEKCAAGSPSKTLHSITSNSPSFPCRRFPSEFNISSLIGGSVEN